MHNGSPNWKVLIYEKEIRFREHEAGRKVWWEGLEELEHMRWVQM